MNFRGVDQNTDCLSACVYLLTMLFICLDHGAKLPLAMLPKFSGSLLAYKWMIETLGRMHMLLTDAYIPHNLIAAWISIPRNTLSVVKHVVGHAFVVELVEIIRIQINNLLILLGGNIAFAGGQDTIPAGITANLSINSSIGDKTMLNILGRTNA